LAAALVVLVAIGLAAKGWRGPLGPWTRDYLAGVVYVVFWILLAKAIWLRVHGARLAAIVLGVTCALEALQLWKPPALEAIRSTWLGTALIGTTFSWLDFPHYVAGAIAGGALSERLASRTSWTASRRRG
jgi:hypothetical protein